MYCNRTATRPVRAGTQRTPNRLRRAENPIGRLICRAHKDGLARTLANLQGGGRWFEPSIAHYKTPAKQRFLYMKSEARDTLLAPFTATRLERAGIHGPRWHLRWPELPATNQSVEHARMEWGYQTSPG